MQPIRTPSERLPFHRTLDWLRGAGLGPFLVRAVAGSGAVRLAGMIASFATGVLLARGLGVEGYGFYSIALAVITIASIPGELGLPLLVTREVAVATAQNDHGRLFGVLRWADKATIRIAGTVALLVVVAALIIFRLGHSTVAGALLLGAPVIPLIALAKTRGGALQGLSHSVRGQVPWILLRPLVLALLLGAVFGLGPRLTPALAMALNSATAGVVLLVGWVWLRQRLPSEEPATTAQHSRRWLACLRS